MLIITPILFFLLTACNNASSSTEKAIEEKSIPETKAILTSEKATIEAEVPKIKNSEITETKTDANLESKETPAKNTNPTPKIEKEVKPKSTPTTKAKTTVKKEKPKSVTPVVKEKTLEKLEGEEEEEMKAKAKEEEKAEAEIKAEAKEGVKVQEVVVEEKPVVVDHSALDALLRQYVSSSGKVNYKGLKSSQAKLDAYLKTLEQNPPQNSWSRNEKLAYWINAYNAYTLKLIVDNYPTSSITNLKGGKPWDVKWINIGGKSYSLNNIENDIIRPRFKEPRIHFAVNCAAKSCPPLLNRAWTASNLNSNFEKQTKNFINNSKYNSISTNSVKVSKIFDWYGVDFGNLIDYLNKYSDTKIDAGAKVEFMEYDWQLNE